MSNPKDVTRRESSRMPAKPRSARWSPSARRSLFQAACSGRGQRAPSDTVNVAIVGFGGMGSQNALVLAQTEHIGAVCDVDFGYSEHQVSDNLAGADGKARPDGLKLQEQFRKAKRYTDFRELLTKEKSIDAVVIATPDHLHAVIAKAAMDLGKHVYVQKPLTASVHEARVLRQSALAHPKVVTQMGNQGHSSEGARLINEWIQADSSVLWHEVHVWDQSADRVLAAGAAAPNRGDATRRFRAPSAIPGPSVMCRTCSQARWAVAAHPRGARLGPLSRASGRECSVSPGVPPLQLARLA